MLVSVQVGDDLIHIIIHGHTLSKVSVKENVSELNDSQWENMPSDGTDMYSNDCFLVIF